MVILATYSSGLYGNERSLCVSRRFLARVCSFAISVVKLEGNQPHCRSRSLSPSYQPAGAEKGKYRSVIIVQELSDMTPGAEKGEV